MTERQALIDRLAANYMQRDSYLNVARRKKVPVFIITIEADETLLRERIVGRGVKVEELLHELPDQLCDHNRAVRELKADIRLGAHFGNEDKRQLLSQLRQFITDTAKP